MMKGPGSNYQEPTSREDVTAQFNFTANPNRPGNKGIGYGVPGSGVGVSPEPEPFKWGSSPWAARVGHFVAVGGLVWWVTKRPLVAMVAATAVAWALDTDAAKELFKH